MSADSSTQRPNLLFIISDQHNPAVTGCYGDPVVETPRLDRLAAGGVVLDNLYCTAPLCVPARMSYMTGQYPTDIETWDNRHILDHGIPTFAHALGAVMLGIAGLGFDFPVFAGCIFLWGGCGGVAMSMARTIMQEQAPYDQRGRVMAFFSFSIMGAGPFGALLAGALTLAPFAVGLALRVGQEY